MIQVFLSDWTLFGTKLVDILGVGVFDQEKAEGNTDPCSNPDFKKIKLGSSKESTYNSRES